MTEKTVEVELKAKPKVLVVLKTPWGEGQLRFKAMKQNQLGKLLIDLEKDVREAIHTVLSSVLSVDNLFDDGELVRIEDVHAGNVTTELASAILDSFVKATNAASEQVSEAELKKDGAGAESAPASNNS